MSEWDSAAAEAHLAAADPVMAGLITLHGRIPPDHAAADPFHALARSIVFQQLSGKAASTIFGRVSNGATRYRICGTGSHSRTRRTNNDLHRDAAAARMPVRRP